MCTCHPHSMIESSQSNIAVISHDQIFCEKVGFTHVGTVTDGRLLIEQGPLQDGDCVFETPEKSKEECFQIYPPKKSRVS